MLKIAVELLSLEAHMGGNNLGGYCGNSLFVKEEVAIWLSSGITFKRILGNKRVHQSIIGFFTELVWNFSIVEYRFVAIDGKWLVEFTWGWNILWLYGPRLLNSVWSELNVKVLSVGLDISIKLNLKTLSDLGSWKHLSEKNGSSGDWKESILKHISVWVELIELSLNEGISLGSMESHMSLSNFITDANKSILGHEEVAIWCSVGLTLNCISVDE